MRWALWPGARLQTLRTTGLTLIDADDKETILPGLLVAETFAELRICLAGSTWRLSPRRRYRVTRLSARTGVIGGDSRGDDPQLRGDSLPCRGSVRGGECSGLASPACAATRLGAAKVKRNPGPLSLAFGPMVPGTLPQGQALASALKRRAPAASSTPRRWWMWAKAMFVTTTGTLGALVDKPIGYLNNEIPEQLEAFMREVETVGRAMGVELPEKVVRRNHGLCPPAIPGGHLFHAARHQGSPA